jgi:hypothetical protein
VYCSVERCPIQYLMHRNYHLLFQFLYDRGLDKYCKLDSWDSPPPGVRQHRQNTETSLQSDQRWLLPGEVMSRRLEIDRHHPNSWPRISTQRLL